MHASNVVSEEAARQSYCVAINGVSRSGSLCKRRKEKQIRGRAERWEYERIAGEHSYKRQQPYGDEAVEKHIRRPDRTWRKVSQQPIEPQPLDEMVNMLAPLRM